MSLISEIADAATELDLFVQRNQEFFELYAAKCYDAHVSNAPDYVYLELYKEFNATDQLLDKRKNLKNKLDHLNAQLNRRKKKENPLKTDPDEVPEFLKEIDEKYSDAAHYFSIKDKEEARRRMAAFDETIKQRGG